MSKYFFSDNPQMFQYEKLMQQVPGFDRNKFSDEYEDDEVCLNRLTISLPGKMKTKYLTNSKERFFINKEHKERFEKIYRGSRWRRMRNSAKYLAAIYLLSAHEWLWECCNNKVGQYGIYFNEMMLRGLDLTGYILLVAAKSVYYTRSLIEEEELIDKELFSEVMISVIANGWKLRVYGYELAERKLRYESYE